MKGINKFTSKELTTSEANILKGGAVFCEWVVGKSNMNGMSSMNADDTAQGHLNGNK